MADSKISTLPAATTPLGGTEVLPIVQGGVTVKVAVSDLTASRTVSVEKLTITATNGLLNPGTVDGSDNKTITISGGGANSAARGANLSLSGNESTTEIITVGGDVVIQTGTAAGAAAYIYHGTTGEIAKFSSTGLALTGTITPTGNLVIGTAGKGIDFSATADGSGTMTSELLSDYEEGTWTPSLGGSTTYTVRSATYTKVGRTVTVQATLLINAIGTGSANTITGLPFTSTSGIYGCSVGYFTNSATAITSILPYIVASGTSIIMSGMTIAAPSITSPIAFFQNSTYFEFSATYQSV